MKVGLRVDVDTFQGTRLGVPKLCRILADHSINATFFFCVGPDNMGRHIWRLLRPTFLLKMLRTKAVSLYGWNILFKGTFWPGPLIGKKLGHIILATAKNHHEVGLHAWDHQAWQTHLDTISSNEIYKALEKGVVELTRILGKSPVCSAVPAWMCNSSVLVEKNKFNFKYNSDCRGKSIFYPEVDDAILSQAQIPVSLPTYDEVVGQAGISDDNYNDYILSLLDPAKLNVLTIHAEVEGITKHDLFGDFLKKAKAKGVLFVPLGELLIDSAIGCSSIVSKEITGREGWVSYQDKKETNVK